MDHSIVCLFASILPLNLVKVLHIRWLTCLAVSVGIANRTIAIITIDLISAGWIVLARWADAFVDFWVKPKKKLNIESLNVQGGHKLILVRDVTMRTALCYVWCGMGWLGARCCVAQLTHSCVPHPFVLTNKHTVNESSSGGKPYIALLEICREYCCAWGILWLWNTSELLGRKYIDEVCTPWLCWLYVYMKNRQHGLLPLFSMHFDMNRSRSAYATILLTNTSVVLSMVGKPCGTTAVEAANRVLALSIVWTVMTVKTFVDICQVKESIAIQ